jgi:hypothetical protein
MAKIGPLGMSILRYFEEKTPEGRRKAWQKAYNIGIKYLETNHDLNAEEVKSGPVRSKGVESSADDYKGYWHNGIRALEDSIRR